VYFVVQFKEKMNMKGIYVLIIKMEEEKNINIGKIGQFIFEPAYYAYVGSAMTGIHRLNRHLRNLKGRDVINKHWHIDFIIPYCKPVGWFFAECSNPNKEENLATFLSKKLDYVKGFGASDSRAPSHLFKCSILGELRSKIVRGLKTLEIINFKFGEDIESLA
jgi:Uri superfamily endonuclease